MTNSFLKTIVSKLVQKKSKKRHDSCIVPLHSDIDEVKILIAGICAFQDRIDLYKKSLKDKAELEAIYNVSRQVAHDIRSPLTALNVLASDLGELPEEKRVLLRSAVHSIEDIANDLSNKKFLQKTGGQGQSLMNGNSKDLKVSVQLISSIIEQIVSEKRIQYRDHRGVSIYSIQNTESYGLFGKVNAKELKRVLSNTINNAVEALDEKGAIKVEATLQQEIIIIIIQDNGRGIPSEILPKLMQQGATFGKEHLKKSGSGLGLYHAKETINSWDGGITIESQLGRGTSVMISLPKQTPPSWFSPAIIIGDAEVVILDDDESIHQVWENRLKSLGILPENIKHFNNPYKLMFWYKSLDVSAMNDSPIFLCDYELIGSCNTGLDVIEELDIAKHSVLVTSHFEDDDVRERCARLGVKLLPKNLAGIVPIHRADAPMSQRADPPTGTDTSLTSDRRLIGTSEQKIDAILIDDTKMIHTVWKMAAKKCGKVIACYEKPDDFMNDLEKYDKTTPLYIDSNLAEGIKGEIIAKDINHRGFGRIYLATGSDPKEFPPMPWITKIVGKEPPFINMKGKTS